MTSESPPTVTAAMLIIGNEILSGRTRDVNLGVFAERLGTRGIRMLEARVVADIEEDIVAAVRALSERYDLVFTTGGIGPTHDDITADAMAKAFGVAIGEDPRAIVLMEAYYGTGGALTPARRRMARIPEGAALIENSVSGAPGFRLGNVHVMAGVPRIAEAMLDAVLESLPRGAVRLRTGLVGAVAESRLAEPLRVLQADYPAVEIGSYPSYVEGKPRTAIVLTGTDAELLFRCKAELAALFRAEGIEPLDEPGEPPAPSKR
jgi:molybdenum cofactor synthesis domain-containing protein